MFFECQVGLLQSQENTEDKRKYRW